MSKIGRKPILIPEGVTATVQDGILIVKGKLGENKVKVLPRIEVKLADKEIKVNSAGKDKQARANWGTQAAHIKNAIAGVTNGFSKKLELQGIGFRASMEGKNLVLSLGFSHPVKYAAPAGIEIKVEKAFITVSGIDAQLVGQTAAQIRALKKPEPYQGKGIRYVGEVVRRKQGKKVAGTTTTA